MAATTDPPKAKPAAKNAPAQVDGGAAPKKVEPRPYRVTKSLTLDLTDPMSLVQQLASVAAGDDENPQPVTVAVVVGTGKGINPKSALEDFGADNDMEGDYEVVAEGSVKEFKNVSTKVKRQVSFS
jgi:hypothetical protein